MVDLFDVPAYFILLRETLEVTIILAVLLGFIDSLALGDESLKKKFKKQIWIGCAAGLGVSLLIGAIFIIVFYVVKRNLWEDSEAPWEGAFSLIASVVITAMSLSMVQAQKWKNKWENKLKGATEQYLKKHEEGNKWALILLPFTVVVREGVETIVFIAGIGFDKPASGLPIPVITGLLSGFVIGFIIYKGSHKLSLKLFFGFTTTLLLFIAAGLFSNSIHELQEATESHEKVIWKLKCCNNGQFWSLMKNLFGWRNKATVGTTVGYFVYWIVVGSLALFLMYKDKKTVLNDAEKGVEEDAEKEVEKDAEKEVEKVTEKEVETVTEKEVETVTEKEVETVTEKEVETVVEEDVEKVTEKEVEKVVEKEVETVVEEEVETVVEEEVEKVVEKEVETVAEKEVETVVEEEVEKVIEKEVETVTEKEVEKVTEKEVETVAEKEVETVTEKEVEKDV